MNKTKWIVTFLLSTILLTQLACTKKKYLAGGNTVQPSSNLITTIINAYQRGNENYSTHFEYFYDQSNRVTLYREYQLSGSIVDTIHIINFSYSGNETLPASSVEKYLNDHELIDIVTHQYSYDTEKRLLLDSLISYNNTIEPCLYVSRRMEYHPLYVVIHNINFNRNTGLKEQFNDSVKLDAHGNAAITQSLFGTTFLSPSSTNIASVGYMYQNFSYTSVPNIFNDMNVKNVLAFVQTGHTAGRYYSAYFGSTMVSSATFSAPGLPGPYPEAYSYTSNPSRGNRVEKINMIFEDGMGTGTITYK